MLSSDPASALLQPTRLWSRAEVLARPSPVPRRAGVYAWYFDAIPPGVPVNGCVQHDGHTLLYIGISPSADPRNGKPPSKQNLQQRIRYHMQGNAEGSTLRFTLGCLLAAELGIELRRVGSGSRLTFADGERLLSEWMDRNAFVTWIECARPWELEHQLIARVCLPLNLDQNSRHLFHSQLSVIRREAKQRARALPVFAASASATLGA